MLDDLGSLDALGTQLSTMHSFNSGEIFMFYSFVRLKNNLCNFTNYILGNVQATSDSFPLFNLAGIVGCDTTSLDDFAALDGIGTQM